jgi:hypothetical protein
MVIEVTSCGIAIERLCRERAVITFSLTAVEFTDLHHVLKRIIKHRRLKRHDFKEIAFKVSIFASPDFNSASASAAWVLPDDNTFSHPQ